MDLPGLPPYRGDPVLVVGNGPVGQTTALLLARWGIPSVLVDGRDRRDAVGSKAICQQRDVLDIWDSVGAGRTIAEEGVTWNRARTMHGEHELFCLDYVDPGASESDAQPSFPPWVNISQSRTEEVLDDCIAESDLVDVRWSHRVLALRDTGDGVAADVDTPAGAVELHAPYAVGCAGAHGDLVREALGARFEGRSFEDRFLICDIRTDLPGWERERRFYFDPEWNPGRQVLIHPCPDSTYRIDWQVPAEFDLDAEEASGALDTRIRRIVGDRDYEIVWKSVYRFSSRCVDRMRRGRILLAGDCAHLVAPFGARGLNAGVPDAENAAWKLAFVLRGWAGSELLESYDTERRAAAAENLAVTTATMDFLVPQTEEGWARRRRLLQQAVHDPSVHSRIDSGRLAEPYWYADSPLSTPDPTREPPCRPARGSVNPPAVGVLLPDLAWRGGRLREVARRGLTVLVADPANAAAVTAAVDGATPAPLAVHPMEEAAAKLGARPGEAWLVRPDAHVAAILPATDSPGLRAAVGRVLGTHHEDDKGNMHDRLDRHSAHAEARSSDPASAQNQEALAR